MQALDDTLHPLVVENVGLAWHAALGWRRSGLEIEDLAQVGAIGLMRAAQDCDPERASFSTYGVLWARSKIGRAAEKLMRHQGLDSLDAIELDPRDDADGPLDALADAETSGRLWAAVELLPAGDREVIEARFREGLSQAEAAERLGVSRTRVYQREKRAVERLRGMLGAA